LVALFATTFAVAQTQLLNNPGFEEWNSDTEPAYWKTNSSAGNASLTKSEDARSGTYAVQINNQSSNKRLAYQETTLAAGTYVFSFYVMGVSEGGAVCPGYVPVVDGKVGSYIYEKNSVTGISATDWQLITYEFTLSDETTISLVIRNDKNTASVLIDDASLVLKEAAPSGEDGDGDGDGDGEENGETVSIANTADTPYTPAQALALIDAGLDLSTAVYVKGIICSAPDISTSYGNATYYISADGTEENKLEIFRGYYLDGAKFTSEDQIKKGDEVVVYGKLVNYNGTKEMTTGSSIISLVSAPEEEDKVTIANTPETAYTTAQAIALIEAGEDLTTSVYVKGTVTAISSISTSYGNATYTISTNNSNDDAIVVYRGLYLENAKFTSEDQLKVGNEVIVRGKLVDYNGTKEISSGNYLYSINGVTTGITSVAAQATDNANVYTIDGQRVQNLQKGKVYIVNGKKVLVK
jgi:hypothetical protein